MVMRPSIADRALDLPPLYDIHSLREAGDAFAHACACAGEKGAGSLIWVRRYDLAEFAVVLEPEEPLAVSRRAFYVGMNALAAAIAAHAPPELPIGFDWPDAIRVDGVLVGGGRLGWPTGADEAEIPPWLVFSGMIRTAAIRASEAGHRPFCGALDELGFEDIDAAGIIASFGRHLMAGFHEWNETGFEATAEQWLSRLAIEGGMRRQLAENGDLLLYRDGKVDPTERRVLADALATPSWLDPATGAPWL